MIIGLIGPVEDDIELVTELLTSEKTIQVVDCVKVIRLCDYETLNSVTVKDDHKKVLLKKLELEFGSIIITGNLILTHNICQYILQEGGLIVVVSRESLEDYGTTTIGDDNNYWNEASVQRYNMETRYKSMYDSLKKFNTGVDNLFFIDISDEESQELERLVDSSNDWLDSTKEGITYESIVDFVSVKGDNTMNMEDSIKKAMKELGMEVEGYTPECDPIDSMESNKHMPHSSPEDIKDDVLDDTTPSELDSIFVKILDGSMAILFPDGLKLESQEIGGMKFNVITVEIPDSTDNKLQELIIRKSVEPESPKSIEQHKSHVKHVNKLKKSEVIIEKPKTEKVDTNSESLSELKDEKLRLDVEIKACRETGDVEEVNILRKQRRLIRNKINMLKK